MLEVKDLSVKVEDKLVLKNLDLSIADGETTVLFGPNGAGKTSLLLTLLGFPRYKIISGRIIFKGKDITYLPVYERVRMGMGVAFQLPPVVRGVKLKQMIKVCCGKSIESVKDKIERLNLGDFLERDINLGFSGGEIKRSEILQLLSQEPDFALLDEPDSGVDIENIEIVGKAINELLKGRSGLIITHLGYILKFIEAKRACVLYDGKILCSGEPKEILENIMTRGYEECVKCPKAKKD
ncbi:MAG: ABC transporter ATP-binding protein [Candidatus Saganbacteria bacterium]|nr:ABC transporter ATP-binding protein [Candidatus Saganbacteria bacterium]